MKHVGINKELVSLCTGLAAALLLAGCATGTHVATGPQHPPLPAESVQVYSAPPAHFESVGLVTARIRGTSQRRMNKAMEELKHQAGLLGANGVVMNPVAHSGLAGRKLNLSGQAIYVQP